MMDRFLLPVRLPDLQPNLISQRQMHLRHSSSSGMTRGWRSEKRPGLTEGRSTRGDVGVRELWPWTEAAGRDLDHIDQNSPSESFLLRIWRAARVLRIRLWKATTTRGHDHGRQRQLEVAAMAAEILRARARCCMVGAMISGQR
jgi:hypothetical protein